MLFDFHNKNSGIKGNYREAGKLFLFDNLSAKWNFTQLRVQLMFLCFQNKKILVFTFYRV